MNPLNLDENQLKELYLNKRLSMRKIARMLDCATKTVHDYLKKYSIPTRDQRESHLGQASWNKGKKLSKKHCEELSKSHRGHIPWNKWIKGYTTSLKGQKLSLAQRRRMSITRLNNPNVRGANHYNWHGGISFEPYGLEFNERLKEQIRRRDNNVCQECGYEQKRLGYKLHVHHIDFNKKNNSLENLISFCRSCHLKTNYNREDWVKYYQDKMKYAVCGTNSKTVNTLECK